MPRTIPGEKLLQVVRGPNSVLFIGLGCVGTWENPHPLANGTGGSSQTNYSGPRQLLYLFYEQPCMRIQSLWRIMGRKIRPSSRADSIMQMADLAQLAVFLKVRLGSVHCCRLIMAWRSTGSGNQTNAGLKKTSASCPPIRPWVHDREAFAFSPPLVNISMFCLRILQLNLIWSVVGPGRCRNHTEASKICANCSLNYLPVAVENQLNRLGAHRIARRFLHPS